MFGRSALISNGDHERWRRRIRPLFKRAMMLTATLLAATAGIMPPARHAHYLDIARLRSR